MILIVGSTGLLGRLVAMKLASAGRPVLALVRDSSSDKAKALEAGGAQLVVGDLKERSSLERACSDAGAVVCTASATLSRREGDSIDTVDVAGVQNLIAAAAAGAVGRLVFVSVSPNMGDDFPLAAAKRAAESSLASSGLEYVVLQPSYFPEVWFSQAVGFDVAGGNIRVYGDGKANVSYISVDDVASAVVSALDTGEASGRTIPIGGPQAVSQLDAIDLAGRASGRQLRPDHLSLDQIRAQRAATEDPLQASFLGMFEHLALGDEIAPAWTEMLAVSPTPMKEWIERAFGNQDG